MGGKSAWRRPKDGGRPLRCGSRWYQTTKCLCPEEWRMVWSVCGEQGNETESENGETHEARYPSSNRARRPLASSHREEWRVLFILAPMRNAAVGHTPVYVLLCQ